MTVSSGAGPKCLGLAVFVLALWAQPQGVVGSFYDDGIYVVLGKALAQGQGFRNIHLPGAPPGVHYPFLYPACLSLLWRIWPSFPANVVLFQLFDAATLGLSAWVIARSAECWKMPAGARYGALVLGFSAFPLLTMVGVRFSEPLFLLLMVGAAAAADRPGITLKGALVAGTLAGLAVLTRSIAISVVGGVALALWLRGERYRAAAALGAAVVVTVPWLAWTASHAHEIDPRIAANYGTYLTDARQAGIGAFIHGMNLGALAPVARLTIPILPLWLWYPLTLLLLGLILWGAVRVWPKAPALVTSLALYAAVVSLWPYVPDRFMWIVTPLFALFFAAGVGAAWSSGRVARVAVGLIAVTLAVGYLRRETVALATRSFARTAEGASVPIRVLATAIEAGTPSDAVVATQSEAAIYLYANRRAVPSELFRWNGRETIDLPPDTTLQYFCDQGVTHVALFTPKENLAPVMAQLSARGDSTVVPLFNVTGGPALYRFRCPT